MERYIYRKRDYYLLEQSHFEKLPPDAKTWRPWREMDKGTTKEKQGITDRQSRTKRH